MLAARTFSKEMLLELAQLYVAKVEATRKERFIKTTETCKVANIFFSLTECTENRLSMVIFFSKIQLLKQLPNYQH